MKKYLTWHPLGKPGAFISKKDYDVVRDFILSTLVAEEMTLIELIALGERQLAGQIEENIAWHILVVKLELEARGIILSFMKIAPHKSQFLKVRRKSMRVLNVSQRNIDPQTTKHSPRR